MSKLLNFNILNQNRAFTAILVVIFLFPACTGRQTFQGQTNQLKGTITISGAFALYPLTVKWAEEFKKAYPEVRIDISAGGAGKGMADVLAGMVDIAMVSRQINPLEIEKGAWYIAVARDAVVGTYNSANPYASQIKEKGLTKITLEKIFISREIQYWQDCPGFMGAPLKINLYTRSDACGAGEIWAAFFNKHQENLGGTGVFGDPGIAEAVRNDIAAIGYNNIVYAYDITTRKPLESLSVIPIDQNQNGKIDPEENFYETLDDLFKAVSDGRYPSPPARDLYLVLKGKPENILVKKFLHWILTEGQNFIEQSGYARLDEEIIEAEINKLN